MAISPCNILIFSRSSAASWDGEEVWVGQGRGHNGRVWSANNLWIGKDFKPVCQVVSESGSCFVQI